MHREDQVRTLLATWSESIRLKDIDRLMAIYAPDAIYFDVVPPLQITGSDAIRENFLRWFDSWESSIGVEWRDLRLMLGGDVAVAHMLHRTTGVLKGGRKVDYWLRATVGSRHSDHQWRITHEHVSAPVDMATRQARTDLLP